MTENHDSYVSESSEESEYESVQNDLFKKEEPKKRIAHIVEHII